MTALTTPTRTRVARHTDREINEAIDRATERRLAWYAERPHLIGRRLAELDREWDVERALEANAAALSLAGLALAATRGRAWLALPVGVAGFLMQHAVQGWCPPLPVLRRLGFRTAGEIALERTALKRLRGDFEGGPAEDATPAARARAALAAAR